MSNHTRVCYKLPLAAFFSPLPVPCFLICLSFPSILDVYHYLNSLQFISVFQHIHLHNLSISLMVFVFLPDYSDFEASFANISSLICSVYTAPNSLLPTIYLHRCLFIPIICPPSFFYLIASDNVVTQIVPNSFLIPSILIICLSFPPVMSIPPAVAPAHTLLITSLLYPASINAGLPRYTRL